MFPSFDEPRFKTPFAVSIKVAGSDIAVTNGPLDRVVKLGDGSRRFLFKPTRPIPTYLVALAVGDFEIVEWEPLPPNEVRSHSVPLRGITAKGKGKQIHYALRSTAAMVRILEDYFQVPYPFQKLDLIAATAFGPGGMENVGAILYRESRILIDGTPSIHQVRRLAGIHAHELAHMWFGNYVTPAWWNDIWLNESFATWMSSKVTRIWQPEMFGGRAPLRRGTWAMATDRRSKTRQVRQPVRTNRDVRSLFNRIVYSKGGAVLSMIEQYIGEAAFREGVRRYIHRNADGVATGEDLFKALAESGGAPELMTAFRSFVEQPGIPLVTVDWSCDSSGKATVDLRQSQSVPLGSPLLDAGERRKQWTIPLCLAWNDAGMRKGHCAVLSQDTTTLSLPSSSCPKAIVPNRNGAAYVNFSLPLRGWKALIEQLHVLPPSEALAVLRSLQAAYEAGEIDTATVITASRAAARSKYWDVVKAPMQNLRHLKLFVVPRSERSQVLKLLQDIYRPRLSKIDYSRQALKVAPADVNRALLRAGLIWFLAVDAREPHLSRALAERGRELVGYQGDGKVKRDALHPNLHRVALHAGLREIGLSFAEVLVKHFNEKRDPVMHTHILHALAHSTDPEVIRRVRSLILDDPNVSGRDASQLLRRHAEKADNRASLFDWIVANYNAIRKRIPHSHVKWLPWRAQGTCDRDSLKRVEAFLTMPDKSDHIDRQVVANVLEEVRLCIAIAEAQLPSALKVLDDAGR